MMSVILDQDEAEKRRKALNKFIKEYIEGYLGRSRSWWCDQSGADEPAVRQFLKGRTNSLSLPTYTKLANFLGVSISVLLGEQDSPKVVPLVGYVGAGAQVYPMEDDIAAIFVDSPPNLNTEQKVVALDVKGDSMFPAYKDGDRIFYSKEYDFIEEECLNNDCVVKVLDGRLLVKELRRGTKPKHFTLLSHNASPIEDAQIEWASPVLWVDKRKKINK